MKIPCVVLGVLATIELLACSAVMAAVPPLEGYGGPAVYSCPTTITRDTPYYSDKIVFIITGALTAAKPVDQQALDALPHNTELDIKVRDNPRAVAFLKSKILTFLGAQVEPINAGVIQILSVQYTVIMCPAVAATPVA